LSSFDDVGCGVARAGTAVPPPARISSSKSPEDGGGSSTGTVSGSLTGSASHERTSLLPHSRDTRRRLLNESRSTSAASEVRSWLAEPVSEPETGPVEEPPPSSGDLLDDILAGGGTAVAGPGNAAADIVK